MFIYNLTYIISSENFNDWSNWFKENITVRIGKNSLIKRHNWLKVKDSPNEGETICLQLFFENTQDLQLYKDQQEVLLDEQLWKQFPNLFVCYKTLMEEFEL